MAPPDLQELALALRTRYGPQDTLIKLSELLFFIESIKELPEQLKLPPKTQHVGAAPERAANARKQHTTKPMADRSQDTAEYRAAKSPTEQNRAPTSSTEQQKGCFTFTANQSALNSATATQRDPTPSTADYTAKTIFTVNYTTPTEDHSAKNTSQPHQKGNTAPNGPSYATIAKEKGSTSRKDNKQQIKAKRATTTAPESLQHLPKVPRPIRAFFKDPETLLQPREAILAKISSAQQAQSIKAIQKVSMRTLLIYSMTTEAGTYLQQTTNEWLKEIGGESAKRLFSIVTHNIGQLVDLEELKTRIQTQNRLRKPILSINRLGKSETIRIGLEDPLEANTLLKNGVLLDYEIKRAEIYAPKRPKHRQTRPRGPKVFYREPKGANLSPQSTQDTIGTQEPQDIEMGGDEWTLIESRKRKSTEIETRKARGRPRFTDKRASNQQSLALYIGPEAAFETPQSTPETPQEAIEAPQPTQATIDD
jgi:hypothetical protein